jgi:hypothetical protein
MVVKNSCTGGDILLICTNKSKRWLAIPGRSFKQTPIRPLLIRITPGNVPLTSIKPQPHEQSSLRPVVSMNQHSCAPHLTRTGQLICLGRSLSECAERTSAGPASDDNTVFSSVPALSCGNPALSAQPTSLITLSPPDCSITMGHPVQLPVHSTPHFPHLPYDVIAIVLEHHIPRNGPAKSRQDLAQFASFGHVSSEWSTYVTPRLYADITFSDVFSANSQRKLCKTLQTNPNLAACVRSCWAYSGRSNYYDEISLFEQREFTEAVGNMINLTSLQLRSVDITTPLLDSIAQQHMLKTLSLVQCLFTMSLEEQARVSLSFRLRKFTMLGCPPLRYDLVISKLFHTDELEQLSIDSQVTAIGLRALRERSLSSLQYFYAEPCRDDTRLFCDALARCPKLVRLGFSHGSKSLPLEEAPFVTLESVGALGHITHWTGPSTLLYYFTRKGQHRLRHVVMDQLIASDGDHDTPYAELLRPRNLSTSPEVESARIFAIQSLVSQPSSLQTLDVVLASSHSVKEVLANCKVDLSDLRVKCTETEGHTVRI